MGWVSQPVLPLLPARARSIGSSAGLLEGPDGGVVFVFGLATFDYAATHAAGRRLAAVQLVRRKFVTATEVASAFAASQATLWRWVGSFKTEGVPGLVRDAPGPKGPNKLTDALTAQIVALAEESLSLLKIAARTGVSTATVRVALGRVTARTSQPVQEPHELPIDPQIVIDEAVHTDLKIGIETTTETDLVDDSNDDASDAVAELVVLAPPIARTAERVAARFGDLVQAPVVITEGAQLPLAGLLLALPALEMTGLLTVAGKVFGPMRKGFYGLRVTLLMGVFMALLREPRAEGATRMRPADLGRVLGLDRAPEVKTLRRKLAELAGHGKGAELQAALGAHHVKTHPDAVGFPYLDGHVRVYSGTRQLPKTHIARMRIAGPATEETWVGDAEGDPVMVITAAPSQSLAAELHRMLPKLRTLIGPDRRCTLVFDRGGYSP